MAFPFRGIILLFCRIRAAASFATDKDTEEDDDFTSKATTFYYCCTGSVSASATVLVPLPVCKEDFVGGLSPRKGITFAALFTLNCGWWMVWSGLANRLSKKEVNLQLFHKILIVVKQEFYIYRVCLLAMYLLNFN